MKNFYRFGILFLITMTMGCNSQKVEINEQTSVTSEIISEAQSTDDIVEETEAHEEIVPFVSDTAKWSTELAEKGELHIDLNMDGKDDLIQLTHTIKEGSQYIEKFNLKIEGLNEEFTLSDYDAVFEKIELFDFDKDGTNEIILMFDTRGGGGEGTHDIYVLCEKSDGIEVKLLEPNVKGAENKFSPYNIDGVYSFEKIYYKGQIKLLTRQYMYGEEGHSDKVGDLVSVISSLDDTGEAFYAEEAWID